MVAPRRVAGVGRASHASPTQTVPPDTCVAPATLASVRAPSLRVCVYHHAVVSVGLCVCPSVPPSAASTVSTIASFASAQLDVMGVTRADFLQLSVLDEFKQAIVDHLQFVGGLTVSPSAVGVLSVDALPSTDACSLPVHCPAPWVWK